jgi:hypothetical protein
MEAKEEIMKKIKENIKQTIAKEGYNMQRTSRRRS